MTKLIRNVLLICSCVFLSSCAVGNRYSYETGGMMLPVRGSGDVGLLVIDHRPYVLSGDKPASFVGLQRGGFGNPFDVKTESGSPLATEMQNRLVQSISSYGFNAYVLAPTSTSNSDVQAEIQQRNYSRNLIIDMYEWKTDAMASFALSYDLELSIKDHTGAIMGSNRIQGTKERLGSAGFESGNSNSASEAFESKMNQLFSGPEIRSLMQSVN